MYVVCSHVEIPQNDFIGWIVRVIDGVDGLRLTCNRGEFKFHIVVEKAFASRSPQRETNFGFLPKHKFSLPSPARPNRSSFQWNQKEGLRGESFFAKQNMIVIAHWNYITTVYRDKNVTECETMYYPTKQLNISSNEVCGRRIKNIKLLISRDKI